MELDNKINELPDCNIPAYQLHLLQVIPGIGLNPPFLLFLLMAS